MRRFRKLHAQLLQSEGVVVKTKCRLGDSSKLAARFPVTGTFFVNLPIFFGFSTLMLI
jgi:hypothetical protein